MAKLGEMYLNYGICYGERILSEDFCCRATSPISHPDEHTDYGPSFWLPKNQENCSFICSGMNSQGVWVSCEKICAVAWQAYDPNGITQNKFYSILNS